MAEPDDPDLPGLHVVLDLEMPADVAQIETVVARVTEQCATLDLPPRQLALNLPVALTEALANAIIYGNGGRPETRVRVRTLADTHRVVLEVADQGMTFDLDAFVVDPTDPEHLEREDGRGIFLMRQLMDRVERVDNKPRGNVVRLTLRREAARAG